MGKESSRGVSDSFLFRLLEEKRRYYAGRFHEEINVRGMDGDKFLNEQSHLPLSFLKYICGDGRVHIIAEVKKASPSVGRIRQVDEVEQALTYVRGGASAISVLTERKYFGGDISHLQRVVRALRENRFEIPVLRKDFVIFGWEVVEAREAGASSFLLISEALSEDELAELFLLGKKLGMEPLVECFSYEGMEKIIKVDSKLRRGGQELKLIGINSRNLNTLDVSLERAKKIFLEFRSFLADKVVVAESGIKTKEDILGFLKLGINVFLVGETLMRAENPAEKIREFINV